MDKPDEPPDLLALLATARSGDAAAVEALCQACYPRVRRVVRRKLDRSMRSLFDSTDFLGDVTKSLVANWDRLDFPAIDSVFGFLARVAERKVIDEYRRRAAGGREP